MKQKLTTERRNNNSIITTTVIEFNTPLLVTDRTTRQKINEEIEDLSNTIKSINRRIQILFKYTSNMLQNRLYIGS